MRLIDADALKKLMEEECAEECAICCYANIEDGCCCKLVDNVPTIIPDKQVDLNEVKAIAEKAEQERPHGEWIEENSETGAIGIKYTWVRCNQCGWNNSLVIPKNFCPNCGAKMKGGAE